MEVLLKANRPSLRMMEGVRSSFDQLLRKTTAHLRDLAKNMVDAELKQVSCTRFDQYVDQLPVPCLMVVVHIEEWGGFLLLRLEERLLEPLVEVLLGGQNSQSAFEGKHLLTKIEQTLLGKFVDILLADFSAIFSPSLPLHCSLERMEFDPRFAAIAPGESDILLMEARLLVGATQGTIDLVIPQTAFSHLQKELPKLFVERESLPNWEEEVQESTFLASLEVAAVLKNMTLPLQETLRWKVGSYLPLGLISDSLIHLYCEKRPLFSGKIGQKDRCVAVRIEEPCEGGSPLC
jgi:flagellar motor switch protein FliM